MRKQQQRKAFMAWYLNCTWPTSSERRGLCLIYLCICRICRRTKQLFRKCGWRSVPFSLSISRWSHLLVCEIQKELPVYQQGWSYLILIISSISNPPICWRVEELEQVLGFGSIDLGVRNAWKQFEKGSSMTILV